MKFVKLNLDGDELRLILDALESRKEMIERNSIAIDTDPINSLIKYLRKGLTSTPNGQFILDSD
jgi:hypothetical protein